MTKKVAIGQAFRLCFPDDLGGMPYEESELPQEEPRNVSETVFPEAIQQQSESDAHVEFNVAEKEVDPINHAKTESNIDEEGLQLLSLLEEGKLDSKFIKAAEKALEKKDLPTIRGILKRHKESTNG